jgi:hypothetical protein
MQVFITALFGITAGNPNVVEEVKKCQAQWALHASVYHVLFGITAGNPNMVEEVKKCQAQWALHASVYHGPFWDHRR